MIKGSYRNINIFDRSSLEPVVQLSEEVVHYFLVVQVDQYVVCLYTIFLVKKESI